MLTLYDYSRSSAAFRVRIALELKRVPCRIFPIHLLNDGGEQHSAAYRRLNPQGLVPTLVTPDGIITQSMAIIEYLDSIYPDPPLLPKVPLARAQVRAMALSIAADIHPIQNLRVLNYLRGQLRQAETDVLAWAQHWIESGLEAFQLSVISYSHGGLFSYGDTVTLADLFLVPQMRNARRFRCNLDRLSTLVEVDNRLMEIPAFKLSAPRD